MNEARFVSLSHADCRTAVILYETISTATREARVTIPDPTRGGTRARNVLRAVCLPVLVDFVRRKRNTADDRRRGEYAAHLAQDGRA